MTENKKAPSEEFQFRPTQCYLENPNKFDRAYVSSIAFQTSIAYS